MPLAIPGFALVAGSGGGAFAVLLGLAPLSLIAAAVGPHDVAPAVLAAIAVLAAVQRSTDVVGVVQRVRQSGPVRVRSVPDHQRHPLGGRSGQGQRRSHQKPRDARQDHRSGHGHVLSRDAARLSEPSPPARNRTESGSVAASCLPDDRMDQSGGCLNQIRPAAVTGSDHARRRPCVPRRREEEPGRKRDCGWRPGGRRRRRSPSPARRRRHHDDSDGDARQHRGDVPGSFLRHRPRRRQIPRRAVQGPGRRRHPPLARRGAGEGQGPAGEARHRHAGGGEGDAAHPHRDHRLHGPAHPRRSTAVGESGDRVGNDRKFPIRSDPKFLTSGLSLEAHRAALLAKPTEREAVRECTNGRPGCC